MARPILTSKEKRDILQPLDPKTGYMNEEFNKLYGEKNNPYVGTERDKRVPKSMINSRTGTDRIKAREIEAQERAKYRADMEYKNLRIRGR